METPAPQPFVPSRTTPVGDLLIATLEPLQENHFPVSSWTTSAINAQFLTTKRFCDAIKIFSQIGDVAIRHELVTLAIKKDFFLGAPNCSVKQIYKYCLWLKSSEGGNAINAIQERISLQKKALPGQSIMKAALQSCFLEQRAEWGQERKEIMAKFENRLADLQRQIELKQEEMEVSLHNLDVDFAPASLFEEQDEYDFLSECNKLYVAECTTLGRPQHEMNDEMIETIRLNYGDQARGMWVDKFLDKGTNAEDLKEWVDINILHLKKRGYKRKASTFRGYLDAVGGELDEAVRTAAAERSED